MPKIIKTDVVIVGSGIAGALVASELAAAGISVIVLEAGRPVIRDKAVQKFWKSLVKVPECAYEQTPQAMFPVTDKITEWYQQSGPDNFQSTYLKVVGGTTWHWLGTSLRLLPSDFQLKTLYGRGVDWPISYAELEPFYGRAEVAIGVAGDSNETLGSPRSTPYPMPPIGQTYLDKKLSNALKDTKYQVRVTPAGRNSVVRDGRTACCGSASCIPVCPVQAKYDATVHIAKAVAAGAVLMDQTNAVKIDVSPDGNISGIHFQRWDKSEGIVKAKMYVLACNAIETPRLLLASRTAVLPNGLANRSDQVGRNLMDHPVQLSWALSPEPVYSYRGPISTSGIENLRDGSFRSMRSAFRTEIGNEGWEWPTGAPSSTAIELVNKGLRGSALDSALADQLSRHFRLASLVEQEPEPDNRVTLDSKKYDFYGIPLPHIHYRLSNYVKDGLKAAKTAHGDIMSHWKASEIHHGEQFFGAGHIMGTTRMGLDPKSSVVDQDLRSHDHPNMFIVGSSVFPTTGTANPTLTLAALSLRAADVIKKAL